MGCGLRKWLRGYYCCYFYCRLLLMLSCPFSSFISQFSPSLTCPPPNSTYNKNLCPPYFLLSSFRSPITHHPSVRHYFGITPDNPLSSDFVLNNFTQIDKFVSFSFAPPPSPFPPFPLLPFIFFPS